MRLLLDTHVYLWWIADSPQLPAHASNLIKDAETVYVSSASVWEMMIKISIGKLKVNPELIILSIERNNFIELPVLSNHTLQLLNLPPIHKDPFDRILLAQAISEPLRFLTCDKLLSEYSELVEVI
jgi:PIN domain nuclease of toxin-antitoxin system